MEKAYGGKSQEVNCPSQVQCKKSSSDQKQAGENNSKNKINPQGGTLLALILFFIFISPLKQHDSGEDIKYCSGVLLSF